MTRAGEISPRGESKLLKGGNGGREDKGALPPPPPPSSHRTDFPILPQMQARYVCPLNEFEVSSQTTGLSSTQLNWWLY